MPQLQLRIQPLSPGPSHQRKKLGPKQADRVPSGGSPLIGCIGGTLLSLWRHGGHPAVVARDAEGAGRRGGAVGGGGAFSGNGQPGHRVRDAGARGPALQLRGQGQRRLTHWHAVQHRAGRATARSGAFGRLDHVPVPADLLRAGDGHVAEHVRMPANQFLRDPASHVIDVEAGLIGALRGDAGVEDDLEQDVA